MEMQDNINELEQESLAHEQKTKERIKKGTVYIAIISITMMFLGLSSAYVVSAGDSFWVKFPMPSFFWISTFAIILSSVTFELAIILMKKGKASPAKTLVLVTTLLGLFFAYSQFKGYGQLVDKGAYVVNRIMVSNGRYGDYFEIRQGNDLIEVNGNSFMKKGVLLDDKERMELQNFAALFTKEEDSSSIGKIDFPEYGKAYTIIYKYEPLVLIDNVLHKEDSSELLLSDWLRLRETMGHIAAGRGDFFIQGEYGKDFQLYYGGEPIQYDSRKLFYKDKPLSRGLQLKLYDSKDNATSYLYILTFLHLLHILATLLYMFAFTKRTYANEFSESNTLGMRATAIFWHYLGVLWLYLLLFLLYIH
jgi:cytochrome c oxidase subunit III